MEIFFLEEKRKMSLNCQIAIVWLWFCRFNEKNWLLWKGKIGLKIYFKLILVVYLFIRDICFYNSFTSKINKLDDWNFPNVFYYIL